MRGVLHSWWFRQGVIVAVAEVLGYLLAIELRDRYPQELCFLAVFCLMTALDEYQGRRKFGRMPSAGRVEKPPLRDVTDGPKRADSPRPERSTVNGGESNLVLLRRPPGA